MLQVMGKPHAATASFFSLPGVTTVPRVSYFYKGIGRVAAELSGKKWTISETNLGALKFEFRMPYFNEQDSSDNTSVAYKYLEIT